MFEDLRKALVSLLPKEVWDAVVYGSAMRGKAQPRDIDIAIILPQTTSAEKKIMLSQTLRQKLKQKNYTTDIKIINMSDLQDPGFLARQAILGEGYSLIHKDYIAERFGFKPVAYLNYSLKNLTPSKKKMVYYALQGRKKGAGLLSKLGGGFPAKGMICIPTIHLEKIKSLLNQNHVEYKTVLALVYQQ